MPCLPTIPIHRRTVMQRAAPATALASFCGESGMDYSALVTRTVSMLYYHQILKKLSILFKDTEPYAAIRFL